MEENEWIKWKELIDDQFDDRFPPDQLKPVKEIKVCEKLFNTVQKMLDNWLAENIHSGLMEEFCNELLVEFNSIDKDMMFTVDDLIINYVYRRLAENYQVKKELVISKLGVHDSEGN